MRTTPGRTTRDEIRYSQASRNSSVGESCFIARANRNSSSSFHRCCPSPASRSTQRSSVDDLGRSAPAPIAAQLTHRNVQALRQPPHSVLMVCYVAVPARIVGVGTGKTSNAAQSGRDKLAAVSGVLGAVVCAPPYAMVRIGLVLLGSNALFWLGVAILVVGLVLQAGVTGAVKAVKVSAKLLAGQPLDTSDGPSASVPGG